MEDNKLSNTYESRNLITKFYFRSKVWVAIKMARLKRNDVILDFGCGGGWLEQKLEGNKIYGYDINPKKTFIKDYRDVKPTKIFALDVFEHIPVKEIQSISEEFEKMSSKFDLIVSAPTENWISRKMRKMVGKSEVPEEHITNWRVIYNLLRKKFRLKRSFNFFSVSKIWVFSRG